MSYSVAIQNATRWLQHRLNLEPVQVSLDHEVFVLLTCHRGWEKALLSVPRLLL
jgi:hypothetical protein